MKEFFDCVISSETIQHSKNPEEEIDLYYNILKNDGKLIISTSNREAPKKIKDIQSEDMEIKEFSKDEFTDLLSKRFQNIEIFSQRIITQSEIQDSKSLEDIRSREKKRYFFAQIIKKNAEEQKNIVEKLMAEFSITHLRDVKATALSGGERRRTEIARCLINNPKVLLLASAH